MDHAVFATRIAGDAVYHAVFVPVDLVEHFLVMLVVTVGHEVAWSFPAFDVARRNRPRGASELALSSEEFLVNGCAENSEALAPFLDLRKLLARHHAGQEKILRLFAEPPDHVLLGRVIIVARRNGVAV